MAFDFEKLFVDVFSPAKGEVVTVVFDVPHGEISDHPEWSLRREMARQWHGELSTFAPERGVEVGPLLSYNATGAHNQDLPLHGVVNGETVRLEDTFASSNIVIAMTEFSASAPLIGYIKKSPRLRAASMPGVTAAMQWTGLAADYGKVANICDILAPLFERAVGAEVTFSTNHVCYFDLSDNNNVLRDNGLLPPGKERPTDRLRNLPSGEVCVVPNENPSSRTAGEIPVGLGDETAVFVLAENQIIDVRGKSDEAKRLKQAFAGDKALRNIAEVAIGCNDKAVVTGNILEDEKAGFHFAYGRSDHLGGIMGVSAFASKDQVVHQDIVYAEGNPVVCKKFDFVFEGGERKTVIVDGTLLV